MKIIIEATPKEMAALVLAVQERQDQDHEKDVFLPPTLAEVEAYKEKMNLEMCASDFWEHYNALGWKTPQGIPISDWRPLAHGWTRGEQMQKTLEARKKEGSNG